MPNRSGKSAAAFIGKAARFLQLIRFSSGFMQINYARMQQTGQPFLSCPVLFWDLCSSHFCITSSSRCDADDGVNPMETVRLMLYRFLPFFSASRRTAPIVLSLRVSRPSLFRIVPGGRPYFFSNAPTVQSLRVCLAIESLLPARLKRAESELNANRRFADNRAVGIADFQFEFN